MNKSLILVLLLIGTGFSACYYDNVEELYPSGGDLCETVEVKFRQHIFPIFQGNCSTVGCHVAGGTGPGIFENYEGIKAKVDNNSIEQRVLVRKDMPPSQPLNDCQLSQIQAWIDAGAPNN
ncbi:MAG: hypothetical protein H0X62_09670 [Bacteroidetes bacterium]|nr:hypothetical protein [Bacteroidota bacterium]